MQDRSEIFRRIKQQYFREQLAPLGFQPMDGMILYLLWDGNCLRQEDIAAQTALDKGCLLYTSPVPPEKVCNPGLSLADGRAEDQR